MTTISAGLSDVAWSLGLLWRHGILILALSAIPAAQRVVAALRPDEGGWHVWPVELLVAVLRIGTFVLVLWLGWCMDAESRDQRIDTFGEGVRAVATQLHDGWPRLLVAALATVALLAAVNILAGPVATLLAQPWGAGADPTEAWVFGIRNLVIIPLFYVAAYGVIRPAFLSG